MMPDRKRHPQTMLVYVHVRRDLAEAGAPLAGILEDVNQKIRARGGLILADRQILTFPIREEWDVDTHFSDELTTPFEHALRAWDAQQREYFFRLLGVSDPVQYAELSGPYDRFCIGARVPQPYLRDEERALALVHATRDDRHYYCPCHTAEVVYTSAHRLVCMGCGQMHCVLAEPLKASFGRGLSSPEWDAAFDSDGELVADIQIPTVEYQDIYATPKIWETDAWDGASGEIEFLQRGDPEEVARYRASLPTAEDFTEAGWSLVPMPPPPVTQLAEGYFGVEIEENAAAALNAGASAYAKSRTDTEALRQAVLSTFQAIELLLKIRLDTLDPARGADRLDNPSVLKALAAHGVTLNDDTEVMIAALRKLRNKFQHSGVRYGYRGTRSFLARALVFLDAFAGAEFGWWVGDVAEQPGWDAMLGLEPVQERAVAESQRRVAMAVADGAEIEACPHCARQTVVRKRPNAGFCLYCRRIPIVKGGALRPAVGDFDGLS